MNRTTRVLVFANITGLAAVLVFNYLSVALPLNGKTRVSYPINIPTCLPRQGSRFRFWGIIYLGLITWVGCQIAALMNQKLALKIAPMLEKIGWLFAYSCFLNIAWLLAWHWGKLLVSVVIMANLLYILTQLNQAAGVGTNKTSRLGKMAGTPAFRHLPGMDYSGAHRQYNRLADRFGLVWRRFSRIHLGHHHGRHWGFTGHFHAIPAKQCWAWARRLLGLVWHLPQTN